MIFYIEIKVDETKRKEEDILDLKAFRKKSTCICKEMINLEYFRMLFIIVCECGCVCV